MFFRIGAVCIRLLIVFRFCLAGDKTPQQVHLSLGQSTEEMVVTWATKHPISEPIVEYSTGDKQKLENTGSSEKLVNDGKNGEMHIHRAIMKQLRPDTRYHYRVGSKEDGGEFSEMFLFDNLKATADWSPRIAVFGDFGFKNGRIHKMLRHQVSQSQINMVIQLGDFAYNLHSDGGRTGDHFLRRLEQVAAYLPYQTIPGNHEAHKNFSNYEARFTMINSADGKKNNQYYSYNVGPVHFVAFSTELYFHLDYGSIQVANQYNWLENDLREANRPENRQRQPWIVTLGHRPMYCSMDENIGCRKTEKTVRYGLVTPTGDQFGLEDLFYQYGVDLCLFAHEHAYERFWPLYNAEVYNGSTEAPYTNPTAPIHFIIGTGGTREGLYKIKDRPSDIAASRHSEYGFSHLTALNHSHLTMEFLSNDPSGKIIDSITVIKNYHGPYPARPRGSRKIQPSTQPPAQSNNAAPDSSAAPASTEASIEASTDPTT